MSYNIGAALLGIPERPIRHCGPSALNHSSIQFRLQAQSRMACVMATASVTAAAGPARVSQRQPRAALSARSSRRAVLVCSAQVSDWAGRQFTLLSTNPASTAHLAELLVADGRIGDAYCLKGDQGAGKSTFCAAFVRAAQEDGGLDVQPPAPSLTPTVYGGDLLFFNLKGLATPDDAARAELLTAFADAVSLVESAEPLPAWGAAPEQRLALYFRRLPTNPDADARLISVVPHTGAWEARVALLHAELSREGPTSGLVVLSEQMALEMLGAAAPEMELLLAGKA